MRVLLTIVSEDKRFLIDPDQLVEAIVKTLAPLQHPPTLDQRDVIVIEGGRDVHMYDCHALFRVEIADLERPKGARYGFLKKQLAEAIEDALQAPFGLSNAAMFNFIVWVASPDGNNYSEMVKMVPALLRSR